MTTTTTAASPPIEAGLPDDARLIQSNVRDILQRESAQEAAREWWANDADYDRRLWATLSGLGIAGMVASDALGGMAASALSAAVVAAELGRTAAAVPFEMHSASLVFADRLFGASLADLGADAGLRRAANGGGVVTTAAPWSDAQPPAFEVIGHRIRGSAAMVPEGAVADQILLETAVDSAVLVSAGFAREHVATLGMNRYANLSLDQQFGASSQGSAPGASGIARAWATLLYSARLCGLGEWMLAQCVEYAGQRVQFGRPIGSFQAIQHKIAEMHIAATATRFLVHHAASHIDDGLDAGAALSRAKAWAGRSVWSAGREAHQIHGGIGFILDHPLHLYFAQALGADKLLGDSRMHQVSLGKSMLLPGGFAPNSLLGN